MRRSLLHRNGRRLLATGLLMVCPLWPAAAEDGKKWGVAPYLGVHRPDLGVLNDAALKAPFVVSGDVVQPDDSTTAETRTLNTDLPAITTGTDAGIEFQLNLTPKSALLIGISSWEGSSDGASIGEFPLQGTVNDVIYNRKVNISYTDFSLGWKRRVYQRGDMRLSTRLSLHELFDFDYRDQNTLLFTEGTAQGFKRIFTSESHATAILMIQVGASAEYFVRDWWSIGLDLGYQLGLDEFVPAQDSTQSDFRPGTDGVSINVSSFNPPVANVGGRAQYKNGTALCTRGTETTCYRDLRIDMDGWKAGLRVTIFY